MKELIKITEKDGKKAVSAKELYDYLGYEKSQWSRWYAKNIFGNKFAIESEDYVTVDIKSNGNLTKDFALTIDFAKKLSMLSRTDNGEKARQYFIECEKQLNDKMTILSEAQMLLMSIQQMQINTIAITEIKQEIKALKASQEIKQDYYTILAYSRLKHKELSFSEAIKKGKLASKLTKEQGKELRKVPDERYGYVYSYTVEILDLVFEM